MPGPRASPRRDRLRAAAVAAALALAGLACGPAIHRIATGRADLTVDQIELRWSNVYVLRAAGRPGAVLVDAGSPGDLAPLTRALARLGLALGDVRAVVLTHAHGDHAGLARALQQAGATIIAGAGDVAMARQGHNRPLRSQSLTAWLIKPVIDFAFTPFSPDVAVDARLDLGAYGLPGAWLEPMPGHTPGSVVVHLDDRTALVGDMMAGGWYGGVLFPHDAGSHYYQDDAARNRRNVQALVDHGVTRFLLGHGGPVDARSVREYLRPVRVVVRAGAGSLFGRGVGAGVELGKTDVLAIGAGAGWTAAYVTPAGVARAVSPGVAVGYRRYGAHVYAGPSLGLNYTTSAGAGAALTAHRWNGSLLLDAGVRWPCTGPSRWTVRAGLGAGGLWEPATGVHAAALATVSVGLAVR